MDDNDIDDEVDISVTECVKRKDKKSKSSSETHSRVFQDYDFNHKRRGIVVIIINNEVGGQKPRKGAIKDLQNLQSLFTHLKFEIICLFNKTWEQLHHELQRIQQEDFSACDCFAMALSSHGQEIYKNGYQQSREDGFITHDGCVVVVRKILAMFNDRKCPGLKGKPRLVFIQACRGTNLDDGVAVLSISSPTSVAQNGQDNKDGVDAMPFRQPVREARKIFSQQSQQINPRVSTFNAGCESFGARKTDWESQPKSHYYAQESHSAQRHDYRIAWPANEMQIAPAPCYNDFLVMYAAPPGYFAFHNEDDGSWFITCLRKVFEDEKYKSLSLTGQLTKVVNLVTLKQSESKILEISGKKQTPVIYSRLTSDVFFFP